MSFRKLHILICMGLMTGILLLPGALGDDDSAELFAASLLQMDITLSGQLDLVPQSSQATLDYVTANVSFIPLPGNQQIVKDLSYSPNPDIYPTHVVYRWNTPTNRVTYAVSATVQSIEYLPPIKNHIPFPILDLPEEVIPYTLPSEMIDSDDDSVQNMAYRIAQGENELFEVVFKVGKWVEQNIEYDLNTLTADVTQSASWVLANGEGVCDEITTLFIGMLRALGIPARFVSGMAYTNYEGKNDWGPHGWAEVYFPGVGWVPFDVTYSEFGYVDPSHIALKRSIDSGEATAHFEWLGAQMDVVSKELEIDTTLKLKGTKAPPKVSLQVTPRNTAVGFGSYNLIEGRATNVRDRRIIADLHLTEVIGLNNADPWVQYVLLDPGETKSIFWLVRIEGEQKSGFKYSYPLNLRSGGVEVKGTFSSTEGGAQLTRSDLIAYRSAREEGEEKSYTRKVDLDCQESADHLYLDLDPHVKCVVRNTGNTAIKGAEGCMDDMCETFDLGIAKSHTLTLPLQEYSPGFHTVEARLSHRLLSKATSIDVEVLDQPNIEVKDFMVPESVPFGQNFTIDATLSRSSYDEPLDLVVTFREQVISSTPVLEADQQNIIRTNSELYEPGKNDLVLLLTYHDQNGRTYRVEHEFQVEVTEVPLFATIDSILRKIFNAIGGIIDGIANTST